MSLFDGFTRIGSSKCSAWEFVPVGSSLQPASCADTDPSHILLMAWTGAQIRPVTSYTREYTTRFPNSRIIVVFTSPWDFCFRTSGRKQGHMTPLVKHLLVYREKAPLRLLMHAFSEGGSHKATLLAEAYHRHSGGARLPVDALCLDSTPGHPSFTRLRNALDKSLQPHPLLKYAGMPIGTAVIAGKFAYYTLFRSLENNPISKTRRQLLNPTYFQPGAPRCYLYSKSDAIVSWEGIQQHMRDASNKDIPITDAMFDGTEHCRHARGKDHLRYWQLVVLTWDKAKHIKAADLESDMFEEGQSSDDGIITDPEKEILSSLSAEHV
ncbi:hypothetical protein E8E11_004579 [Didymella keratinophila]|nr:hypothetical protein E8E11_004579 [Didymella keratinophila]